MSETLNKLDIDYIHVPELGIVSDKRKTLETVSDYNLLFDDYEKTTLKSNKDEILNLLTLLIENRRVAITCFEADVCMCHRGRIAKAIQKLPSWEYKINHI